MSAQVPISPAPTQNAKAHAVTRQIANFSPNVWGDQFLTYTSEDTITLTRKEQEIKELREEVRSELIATASNPSQQLKFIDALQCLGIAYHFESEIEEALKHIYDNYQNFGVDNMLYNAALLFRLLRQEGFNIPCDIFNKFKDGRGSFKESLKNDIPAMLALYEAAHLGQHGEDILDEALAFTTAHLESMATHLSNPLADEVIHALVRPIRKDLPRLKARHYMSIYQEDGSLNENLLKLAKLDFNFIQSLHRKELSYITGWWKDVDFASKLPVRDRMVEMFFWILGVYYEPQYHLARKITLKVIAVTSVIDDIFDAFGTIEELEPLMAAIQKWDITCIHELPEYMKPCYQTLIDIYEEFEEDMAKEGRSSRVHYARQAMKNLVQAYYVEAKWFHEDYIPTMQEYMQNALKTSGYPMLATTSFVGMGDGVTEESFDWVSSNPKILEASSLIARLMNDMVGHEFEQKRGHVVSAVECYMKQYGVSEQEVNDEFQKQIVNAWKDINEEFIRPTAMPMPLLMRILNLSRGADVIYKNGDSYTHVGKEMKDRIASLLIDPVPV